MDLIVSATIMPSDTKYHLQQSKCLSAIDNGQAQNNQFIYILDNLFDLHN